MWIVSFFISSGNFFAEVAYYQADEQGRKEPVMISFEPFWDTITKSNETQYSLIKYHRISPGHLNRLRNNLPLTTDTINSLCTILNCGVDDIMLFVPSETEDD